LVTLRVTCTRLRFTPVDLLLIGYVTLLLYVYVYALPFVTFTVCCVTLGLLRLDYYVRSHVRYVTLRCCCVAFTLRSRSRLILRLPYVTYVYVTHTRFTCTHHTFAVYVRLR